MEDSESQSSRVERRAERRELERRAMEDSLQSEALRQTEAQEIESAQAPPSPSLLSSVVGGLTSGLSNVWSAISSGNNRDPNSWLGRTGHTNERRPLDELQNHDPYVEVYVRCPNCTRGLLCAYMDARCDQCGSSFEAASLAEWRFRQRHRHLREGSSRQTGAAAASSLEPPPLRIRSITRASPTEHVTTSNHPWLVGTTDEGTDPERRWLQR